MHTDAEITDAPTRAWSVHAHPWEAQASQWVYRPQVIDLASGGTIWTPIDARWSLDRAVWESGDVMTLRLRRFPGAHQPPFVDVVLDCASMTAMVDGEICAIAALDARIDALLMSRPVGALLDSSVRGR